MQQWGINFQYKTSYIAKILLIIAEAMITNAKPIDRSVSLNCIHKKHDNPWDERTHSLMINTHIPKISSNQLLGNDLIDAIISYLSI